MVACSDKNLRESAINRPSPKEILKIQEFSNGRSNMQDEMINLNLKNYVL